MVGWDWVDLKMRKEKISSASCYKKQKNKILIRTYFCSSPSVFSFLPFLPPPFPLPPPPLLPLLPPLLKRYKIESPPSPLHSSVFIFSNNNKSVIQYSPEKKLRKEFDFAYSMNDNAACGTWIDDDLGGGEHA